MPHRLVAVISLAACSSGTMAAAESLAAELQFCREIYSNEDRLACYDGLTSPVELSIDGKGSAVTQLFEVTEPRVLRFQSSDAIMVVYLLNQDGEVVQNLHRGGAGEGQHVISYPGHYRVQVNATGGWSLRLEIPD